MHIVDAVTFELSKQQASQIYKKLKRAKVKGLKYSVIKNGIGAITRNFTLAVTIEKKGYKVVAMSRKGEKFIEHVSVHNLEKLIIAILRYDTKYKGQGYEN